MERDASYVKCFLHSLVRQNLRFALCVLGINEEER